MLFPPSIKVYTPKIYPNKCILPTIAYFSVLERIFFSFIFEFLALHLQICLVGVVNVDCNLYVGMYIILVVWVSKAHMSIWLGWRTSCSRICFAFDNQMLAYFNKKLEYVEHTRTLLWVYAKWKDLYVVCKDQREDSRLAPWKCKYFFFFKLKRRVVLV